MCIDVKYKKCGSNRPAKLAPTIQVYQWVGAYLWSPVVLRINISFNRIGIGNNKINNNKIMIIFLNFDLFFIITTLDFIILIS